MLLNVAPPVTGRFVRRVAQEQVLRSWAFAKRHNLVFTWRGTKRERLHKTFHAWKIRSLNLVHGNSIFRQVYQRRRSSCRTSREDQAAFARAACRTGAAKLVARCSSENQARRVPQSLHAAASR